MSLFKRYDLIVATPNFWTGGAEMVAVGLCNEAVDSGMNKVAALCFYGRGELAVKLDPKVELVDLTKGHLFASFIYMVRFLFFAKGPLVSCQRFSNVFVGAASFFSFRPRVLVFREATVLMSLEAKRGLLKRKLMKLVYKRATHIIANSTDTRDDLLKWGICKKSNTVVIGNPVIPKNITLLKDEAVNHEWFSGNYRVILNVGRLHADKDLSTLLRSSAPLLQGDDRVRLVLIGEGPQRQQLEELATTLGISRRFDILPFTSNVYKYMSKADVYVSTSIMEGFGNTIIEAHAAGLAVICVQCPGGSNQLAANARGSLVVGRDCNAICSAIKSVLDSGVRNEGKEWEEYTQQRIFGVYKALFS